MLVDAIDPRLAAHRRDESRLDASRAARVRHAQVTAAPVDADRHLNAVADEAAGAVVTFVGQVRNHDHGRGVLALEYTAHPSAQLVLERLADEAAAAYEGVRGVSVSHRIGRLEIGEVALYVAVAADHRAQAFAACAELVEQIKERLPIWKRQTFAAGESEWVGCA